jgi:small subunit ribosomal protein S30e
LLQPEALTAQLCAATLPGGFLPTAAGGECCSGVEFPGLQTCCALLLSCFAFLFPGKVHGSLARAGKVRSQTPKVAKAEKKKVPKGRAFQRLKYNRRFVNVGERLEHPLRLHTYTRGRLMGCWHRVLKLFQADYQTNASASSGSNLAVDCGRVVHSGACS